MRLKVASSSSLFSPLFVMTKSSLLESGPQIFRCTTRLGEREDFVTLRLLDSIFILPSLSDRRSPLPFLKRCFFLSFVSANGAMLPFPSSTHA